MGTSPDKANNISVGDPLSNVLSHCFADLTECKPLKKSAGAKGHHGLEYAIARATPVRFRR